MNKKTCKQTWPPRSVKHEQLTRGHVYVHRDAFLKTSPFTLSDAGFCGKNTTQEAIRKLCGGYPFPAQKLFKINAFTKYFWLTKIRWSFLSFWMIAHVGRYLNMDPQQSANPTSLEKFSRCGAMWKKSHFSGYVFCWGKLTYEMTGRCNRWLCIQRWNFGIGGVGTLSDSCLTELINIALGFRGIIKHYKAILPEENE